MAASDHARFVAAPAQEPGGLVGLVADIGAVPTVLGALALLVAVRWLMVLLLPDSLCGPGGWLIDTEVSFLGSADCDGGDGGGD